MADGEKGKEAFCLIRWRATGGQVTPDYRLKGALSDEGVVAEFASGYCTTPGDCWSCPEMQAELAQHLPGTYFWLCSDCTKDMVRAAKAAHLPFLLPGHYGEGQCQRKACHRPPHTDDEGTHEPGFSRFLQLYFGPIDN